MVSTCWLLECSLKAHPDSHRIDSLFVFILDSIFSLVDVALIFWPIAS